MKNPFHTTSSPNNPMSTTNKTAPASKPATPLSKLLHLSKTLQFAWFLGHVTTLLSSIICFSSLNRFFYRLAWFGVLESFGIITYQHYYPKSNAAGSQSQVTPQALLHNGDVLYFALAFLWFLSPMFTLALLPYAMFSTFHVLIYSKSVLLPEVVNLNADNSKLVGFITTFVRNYNERCMYWVGSIELALEGLLALRALLFYPRSWIVFLAYSLFVKIRYENSKYMQATFAQWRVRLDGIMSSPSVPLVIKRAYGGAKSALIRVSHFRLSKPQPAAAKSTPHSAKGE